MLFIVEELDNLRSTVTVDPTYDIPNGAACMGHTQAGANCPFGAGYAVQFLTADYHAMETYCDRCVGDGLVNYLTPEPDGCLGNGCCNL